jgi:hypothetical protein
MTERGKLPDWSSDTRLGELVPDGYTVLDYTMQVKALSPDGSVVMLQVKTPDLAPWEAYGMVMSHSNDLGLALTAAGRCVHDDD